MVSEGKAVWKICPRGVNLVSELGMSIVVSPPPPPSPNAILQKSFTNPSKLSPATQMREVVLIQSKFKLVQLKKKP